MSDGYDVSGYFVCNRKSEECTGRGGSGSRAGVLQEKSDNRGSGGLSGCVCDGVVFVEILLKFFFPYGIICNKKKRGAERLSGEFPEGIAGIGMACRFFRRKKILWADAEF